METAAFTFAFDDALIAPVTPAGALARLFQLEGALQRHAELSQILSSETLERARETLIAALQSGENQTLQNALTQAQNAMGELYSRAEQSHEAVANFDGWQLLGWPDPKRNVEVVLPIDVSTIIVTHARPLRQVLTTIAFADAIGAMGYTLREIRTTVGGEDWEDAMVAAYVPVFARVRMGAGTRRFRIESRNAHGNALSEVFALEIPER